MCDVDATDKPPVTLSCPTGKVIRIQSAAFGRSASSSCPGPAGPCTAANVLGQIQQACESLSSCSVTVASSRTPDPCIGVRKELFVTYTCANTPGAWGSNSLGGRCVRRYGNAGRGGQAGVHE